MLHPIKISLHEYYRLLTPNPDDAAFLITLELSKLLLPGLPPVREYRPPPSDVILPDRSRGAVGLIALPGSGVLAGCGIAAVGSSVLSSLRDRVRRLEVKDRSRDGAVLRDTLKCS